MDAKILELRNRVPSSMEAKNVSAGFLTALQVLGLPSAPTAAASVPNPSRFTCLGRSPLLSPIIAALDRLAAASAWQDPPRIVTVGQKLNPLASPLRLSHPKAGQA